MNGWQCDFPGCKSTAVGVGSAKGLQAIGWYFQPGTNVPISLLVQKPELIILTTSPTILCPAHHKTATIAELEVLVKHFQESLGTY